MLVVGLMCNEGHCPCTRIIVLHSHFVAIHVTVITFGCSMHIRFYCSLLAYNLLDVATIVGVLLSDSTVVVCFLASLSALSIALNSIHQ